MGPKFCDYNLLWQAWFSQDDTPVYILHYVEEAKYNLLIVIKFYVI